MNLGEPALFPTLEAHAQAPIVGGNRLTILLNGEQIYPAILEAIRRAQTTITYAQYSYEDGQIARELAEALAERCRAGVRVHVLLDSVGTLAMPREYTTLMFKDGCDVVSFRPIGPFGLNRPNNRNHRRILVVDGRVGFTGGSGVSHKWMGNGRVADQWRDTDVRVEGPVVECTCRARLPRTGSRPRGSSSAGRTTFRARWRRARALGQSSTHARTP